MRRQIVSTLSILTLFGAPTISHALSCAPRHFTLNDAYEAADSIIVGLITECKQEISSEPWAHGGSDCSFTSIEVLKESTPTRDYSGVTSSSGCGLSLHVGGQYLLFLDSENQPMHFSASLSGDLFQAQFANRYLGVLGEFRDGVDNDLAEPWMFAESDGSCSIWLSVRGNRISFSRRTVDAPQQPKPDWTQETISGETVYRANVPSYNAESRLPAGNVEIVVFGDTPDFVEDALMLTVNLVERWPAAIRQAEISVGDRTWSLNRMEMNVSLRGPLAHKIVQYYRAGDVAEQILSAMAQPSDIAVSATVAEISINPASPEGPPSDQNSFVLAPSKDASLDQAVPEISSTGSTVAPNVRAARSYRVQEEPPEPVLRVESRSTQLSSVIGKFRSCYALE